MATKKVHHDDDFDLIDDCDKPRAIFYQFKEHDEILKIIDNFPNLINNLRQKEKSYDYFSFVCNSYQEQPHLIDPYLQDLFDRLIKIVKTKYDDDKLMHESFKYMHSVAKMRGYKKIVQYLPHEVADFEFVLGLLAKQDPYDFTNWFTRYMLLLWLSIVCMIPFDLSKFDAKHENPLLFIMNRVINISVPYLFVNDKSRDAAAYLLGKFFSRPDVSAARLNEFHEQLLKYASEGKQNNEQFKLLGACQCLASLFKYVKREELLKFSKILMLTRSYDPFLYVVSLIKAVPTLQHILNLELTKIEMTVTRKFFTKIVQRIGLTFFKEKVAKWRYERGSRVLLENFQTLKGASSQNVKNLNEITNEIDENDAFVPEEIEDIIEQLLLGLKDSNTNVRWSSAKGIGRVCNRLSRDMAEDILSSILELFTFEEDDSAWHGGCLAIAELGRRGLLLPKQLDNVVPIILKALVFDKKLGNYSLGRNVRDSACYVCWSFARAFEPLVIQPYVNEIASTLLVATVFDREVNCRRAASAAFQENVGRQGQFPYGIEILTKADYFAVGQRLNCYLNLSVAIARYSEYTKPLLTHLLDYKFNHWDVDIRELTSKAFFNLTSLCPEYMSQTILSFLLKQCLHFDLNTRHGALLSLSQIIHALCVYSTENEKAKSDFFKQDLLNDLKLVISKLQDAKFFKGLGGEILRPACCLFIEKLSISKPFGDTSIDDECFLKTCEDFLFECIEYNKEDVQQSAFHALPYYCDFYSHDKELMDKVKAQLINKCLSNMSTSKEYIRSGYSMALGSLPLNMLENNIERIIKELINSTQIHTNTQLWVQSRKDSIKAIVKILDIVKSKSDFSRLKLTDDILTHVFIGLFEALNDYTVDSKGDSGSKVRETAIEALEHVASFCGTYSRHLLTNDLLTKIFAGIMRQAVERIDRTRKIAGITFQNLLYSKTIPVTNLPYCSILRSIFTKFQCDQLEWNTASSTFCLFVRAIGIQEIQYELLTGFVFSIGALTESVVQAASKTFLKELQDIHAKDRQLYLTIVKNLLKILQNNSKNERLVICLIKTIDLIIQYNLLNDEEILKENIPSEFYNLFLENCRKSSDIQKLMTFIDYLCDMLQFKETLRSRCMIQLMIMLCHQYPRIRKAAAGKLYESILNDAELVPNEENYDETITLLTETDWDQTLEIVRPIRNRICVLTNTPQPVMKAKAAITK